MLRRSRSHGAPGDIALMAVVTKAMGAFLILTVMLLPYYREGDPTTAPKVDEMRQRVDKAVDKIRDMIDQGAITDPEDLIRQLKEALAELETARNMIADLRARLDQAADRIRRLEGDLASAMDDLNAARARTAELEQLVASLQAETARLSRDNELLRREIERLKSADPTSLLARIRELEQQVRQLTGENQRLSQSLAEQVLKTDAIERENVILRRGQGMPSLFETLLFGSCPRDEIEMVFMPVRGDEATDGIALAPWRDPDKRGALPIRGTSFSFPAAQPVPAIGRILAVIPLPPPGASIDVYFRFTWNNDKFRSEFDKLVGEAQKQYQMASERVPEAKPRILETIRQKMMPPCAGFLMAITRQTAAAIPPAQVSLLQPVAFLGRAKFNDDGRLTVSPHRETAHKLSEALSATLCEQWPDRCDVIRGGPVRAVQ